VTGPIPERLLFRPRPDLTNPSIVDSIRQSLVDLRLNPPSSDQALNVFRAALSIYHQEPKREDLQTLLVGIYR
jgi:hypothetical protein